MRRMRKSFLERDPLLAAEQLIGCQLVRRTEEGVIRVQITETEAYKGADDPASHAHRGMTPRTRVMFGEAGRLYVYFIYGMHFCMNVVAHAPGAVGAVLLRGAKPVAGTEHIRVNRPNVPDQNLLNGPAKLTQGLQIDKTWNGYDVIDDPAHRLALTPKEQDLPLRQTPRIGVTRGKDLPWRFVAVDAH